MIRRYKTVRRILWRADIDSECKLILITLINGGATADTLATLTGLSVRTVYYRIDLLKKNKLISKDYGGFYINFDKI